MWSTGCNKVSCRDIIICIERFIFMLLTNTMPDAMHLMTKVTAGVELCSCAAGHRCAGLLRRCVCECVGGGGV